MPSEGESLPSVRAIPKKRGYNVRCLDFVKPGRSCGYNPYAYIRTKRDIEKMAYIFAHDERTSQSHADPFWEQADVLLFSAMIAYSVEKYHQSGSLSDLPLKKVLAMPVGTAWVFRRGSSPLFTRAFDSLDKFREMKEAEAEEELTEKSGCFESLMAS